MNAQQIKSVLAAYRPGHHEPDAEQAQALEELQENPALQDWFERQQRFHRGVDRSLRGIPVPAALKESLLAQRTIVPLPWWRHAPVWAAAAAFVLLAAFAALQLWPHPEPTLVTYRSRMVGNVLRQYSMDIVTNDTAAIRTFLAKRGAPSDFKLPPGLDALPRTGAGVMSWQGRPVSMVCLNGGKTTGTLFLFITASNAVPHDRPVDFADVSTLGTVTWEQGGKLYLLAAAAPKSELRKYL